MTGQWLIRECHDDDLEAVIRLLDTTPPEQTSVFSLMECVSALRSRQPCVVAVRHGEVIGAALSLVSGDRAWVIRLAVLEDVRGLGMVSDLLPSLETLLIERRVRRISYVLREEEQLALGLENAGFRRASTVAYFSKKVSVDPDQVAVLDQLGGRMLPDGLWDSLAGMEHEKLLIEQRVLSPLAQPELAQRHGVRPPRAIVLFGPPGTGKTTFARAIASKMGWPFVELLPSRLAADPSGLPAALRQTFEQVAKLEQVVVFVDEVEEIASARNGKEPTLAHAVTNELLKLVPSFRQHDTRLLVCATNTIAGLDPAFVRPGRFDYILPIGTPDESARAAIWRRYVGGGVDVDALVAHSDRLTPAEIEYAAHSGAQASFERDLASNVEDERARPLTDDYIGALQRLKPSVDVEQHRQFERDIEEFGRM